MSTNDNAPKDIFAEAEAEVEAERLKAAKEDYKKQLRKVAAAKEVLKNEERQLEVLRRSIEG